MLVPCSSVSHTAASTGEDISEALGDGIWMIWSHVHTQSLSDIDIIAFRCESELVMSLSSQVMT
eukprot:m.220210 g.220210  ORF g.220210 m.220210 type:complete len:64 (+) comp15116_c1_seq48:5208-5399(+)